MHEQFQAFRPLLDMAKQLVQTHGDVAPVYGSTPDPLDKFFSFPEPPQFEDVHLSSAY